MDRLVKEAKSGQTKNLLNPIIPTGKLGSGGGVGAGISNGSAYSIADLLA